MVCKCWDKSKALILISYTNSGDENSDAGGRGEVYVLSCLSRLCALVSFFLSEIQLAQPHMNEHHPLLLRKTLFQPQAT